MCFLQRFFNGLHKFIRLGLQSRIKFSSSSLNAELQFTPKNILK